MSEYVLKTLACPVLRVDPSKFLTQRVNLLEIAVPKVLLISI